jgi:hypothetical protein
MSIGRTLSRLALSSWFLALVPSLITFFFLPELGKEYLLLSENTGHHPFPIIYGDLNGDGITERLMAGTSSHPYMNMVAIQDNDGHWHDQWNLPGNYAGSMSPMFVGNYDSDRFGEVYIFTMRADSVFLNVNEFFEREGTILQHVFITRIKLFRSEVTSTLSYCGFFDQNGDGKQELYFSIGTGYALEPRKLYFFDLVSKQLNSSPYTAIDINYPFLQDLDSDGRPEIAGQVNASGNHHFTTPFSDYSAWVMVYDDQLRFKFKPIEFPGFGNSIAILPFNKGTRDGYVAVVSNGSAAASTDASKLMVCSPDGQILREKMMRDLGTTKPAAAAILRHPTRNRIVLLTNPIRVLNEDLDVITTLDVPFDSDSYPYQADVNGDGENELFVYSVTEHRVAIYNSSLTAMFGVLAVDDPVWRFSTYVGESGERKLFLSTNGSSYFIQAVENPYYILGYLVYPAVYFVFLSFILIIRKITTYQIARKEDLKKRLLAMQLQSVKAQLDPHFTFNTLNSVASLLYLEDRDTAYDALNNFTRLLRQMLNDADRIYRTLQEELEFVTGYLDLEKVRFGNKFSYEIGLGEGVTGKEQVPKMVLQTFAENAVKHGIMPMKDGGLVRINVAKEKALLKLSIEDNGIGREKASANNGSPGKGLKMTREFYEILNQLHAHAIDHRIIDLYDDGGTSSGTRVEITVPVDEVIAV